MKKLIPFLVLVTALIPSLFAASLTVSWDGSCDTNVLGHWIKWGYVSSNSRTNLRFAYTDDCGSLRPMETNLYRGIYTNAVFLPGRTNTTYVINNLLGGTAYAITCTRTNRDGMESDFSEEVIGITPASANNRPSAVQGFQILKAEK